MSQLLVQIEDLPKAHQTVLQAIIELLRMRGPMTRCDLEDAGDWRSGQVSGRVHDGLVRGLLVVVDKVPCLKHEARGGVELLDVAPWLRKGGKPTSLDHWMVNA